MKIFLCRLGNMETTFLVKTLNLDSWSIVQSSSQQLTFQRGRWQTYFIKTSISLTCNNLQGNQKETVEPPSNANVTKYNINKTGCSQLQTQYSGTSPYDHLVNTTTSLLQPLFFVPTKCPVIFLSENPINPTTLLMRPTTAF